MQQVTPRRVLQRLRGREVHRLFARLLWVRRLHRWYRVRRTPSVPPTTPSAPGSQSTQLAGTDRPGLIEELRRRGIATGLQLPPPVVEELVAQSLPWLQHGNGARFADVRSPLRLPSVQRVAYDEALFALAAEYLGYGPKLQMARLWWVQPDPSLIAVSEPASLHWDIWSYNSVSAFFYLTEGCRTRGAHTMMIGSHRRKSPAVRFGSCEQPFQSVLERFGPENQLVVEGPPGTGFLEDPFAVHGHYPTGHPRLMLQVRYV